MATFLKCTDKDGTEIFFNFDFVFQMKRLPRVPAENRDLTELALNDPLGSILVRDPPDSLDRQVREYVRGS
jgi:hypothetical protein